MKNTAEESAELKMALKHDPCTAELAAEAQAFPLEADEAIGDVENGYDTAEEGSWVSRELLRKAADFYAGKTFDRHNGPTADGLT